MQNCRFVGFAGIVSGQTKTVFVHIVERYIKLIYHVVLYLFNIVYIFYSSALF